MSPATRNTFITSSPRWLITFTAMRPLFGLGNGREVSLLSVAQASASISALSVVWSSFFLVVGQTGEARGECVGNEEVHQVSTATGVVI